MLKGKFFQKDFFRVFMRSFKEVLLLVISILLAFKINQWDANRKKTKALQSFLMNLDYSLRSDTSMFRQSIGDMQEYSKWSHIILNTNAEDTLPVSSLIAIMKGYFSFQEVNMSPLDKLKNSDFSTLPEYQYFFDRLTSYFNYSRANIDKINRWGRSYKEDADHFWMAESGLEIFYSDSIKINQSEETRKSIALKILHSPTGRNYVSSATQTMDLMILFYQRFIEETTKVLQETDSIGIINGLELGPVNK